MFQNREAMDELQVGKIGVLYQRNSRSESTRLHDFATGSTFTFFAHMVDFDAEFQLLGVCRVHDDVCSSLEGSP